MSRNSSNNFLIENFRSALQDALDRSGLTRKDFAKQIGITAPYLSDILNGKKTGEKRILDIAKRANIPLDQIFADTGIGLGAYSRQFGPIPVISWVKAGEFAEAADMWPVGISGEGEPVFSKVKVGDRAFALRVEGDSMWPRFHPGDIIIVDPEIHCENGQPCVVFLNGEVSFKYLKMDEDEIKLVPGNDKYPTVVINKSSRVDFHVIGRVVDMVPGKL